MNIEFIEGLRLFGNRLVDFKGVGELLFRFGIDLLVIYIIIGLIFYKIYKQKSYFVSYFLINISVFLVCILLNSLKLKIGFAFGLFAVFSIIRYRTEPIPIKQMTYLFVAIIIGVMNALSVKKISYAEMITCNAVIVIAIYILEMKTLRRGLDCKTIRYEKIELIKPERKEELIADLKERTGLQVESADIDTIDFLNDTATIRIHYVDS